MKQRFAVTLLAVAIASLSASAFAIAPVINDFRSPIIADDTPVTNSNYFVYPDVFDLNTKATDPDATVTPANIIWSFTEATGTYSINNRASMNVGGGDNPNAPGAKSLAAGDDTPTTGTAQDSNVRTITFRNKALSPVGGPNVDPGTAGIKTAQTKVLTLFASDGSSYTQKSFLVYTYNNGADALSGKSLTPVTPLTTPGTGGATGWTTFNLIGTTTFTSGSGLCIQVPAAGDNFGGWISPFGAIQLVKNNVYRVRLTVAGVPAIAQNATPLWDFVFDNFNAANTAQQESKYSTDLIVWDTFSGANAAGPAAGDHSYDIWWAPLPIQATDWNDPTTGEFSTAHDAANDVRLQFRLLDVSTSIDGQNDSGTLCLQTWQVDRIDIADLAFTSTVYDNQTLAANNTTVGNLFGVGTGAAQTTVTYSGGDVTITPNSSTAWNVEIVTLDVGNTVITPNSEITDNWPIPWVTDQLVMTTAGIQAPDATGQTNPPDALRIMMDTPTSELGIDSMVLAGANTIGLPKTAAATTYTLFFHANTRTLSGVTEHRGLRPRVSLICVPGILSGGSSTNSGGIKVNFIKSQAVDIAGL